MPLSCDTKHRILLRFRGNRLSTGTSLESMAISVDAGEVGGRRRIRILPASRTRRGRAGRDGEYRCRSRPRRPCRWGCPAGPSRGKSRLKAIDTPARTMNNHLNRVVWDSLNPRGRAHLKNASGKTNTAIRISWRLHSISSNTVHPPHEAGLLPRRWSQRSMSMSWKESGSSTGSMWLNIVTPESTPRMSVSMFSTR